jgi:hypothetical protein
MSENQTPSAEDLAAAFPDIYFDLQCAHLLAELQEEHHFQATVTSTGKGAEAVVQLNDSFALVLTPAIPGFGGYKNWMLSRTLTDPRTKREIKLSQYRCGVELIQNYGSDQQMSLLTFGLDSGSIEELIGKALDKVRERCELRLVALPVLKIETPGN